MDKINDLLYEIMEWVKDNWRTLVTIFIPILLGSLLLCLYVFGLRVGITTIFNDDKKVVVIDKDKKRMEELNKEVEKIKKDKDFVKKISFDSDNIEYNFKKDIKFNKKLKNLIDKYENIEGNFSLVSEKENNSDIDLNKIKNLNKNIKNKDDILNITLKYNKIESYRYDKYAGKSYMELLNKVSKDIFKVQDIDGYKELNNYLYYIENNILEKEIVLNDVNINNLSKNEYEIYRLIKSYHNSTKYIVIRIDKMVQNKMKGNQDVDSEIFYLKTLYKDNMELDLKSKDIVRQYGNYRNKEDKK